MVGAREFEPPTPAPKAGTLQYHRVANELGVSIPGTGNDTDSKHNYEL